MKATTVRIVLLLMCCLTMISCDSNKSKIEEKAAQGGLSVAGGCRCLTKELDMIAC